MYNFLNKNFVKLHNIFAKACLWFWFHKNFVTTKNNITWNWTTFFSPDCPQLLSHHGKLMAWHCIRRKNSTISRLSKCFEKKNKFKIFPYELKFHLQKMENIQRKISIDDVVVINLETARIFESIWGDWTSVLYSAC